ncbi:MAG TPA: hypothetical protein VGR57_03355 [Ktedonobacterales bacterium]|nr:hypothetical protein [Ktedonobacterales bacterium]
MAIGVPGSGSSGSLDGLENWGAFGAAARQTRPLPPSGGLGACVECGHPIAVGRAHHAAVSVLCDHCDTRHRERTHRQEVTREALAWAFVTLVFLALLAWGVVRLAPHL